MAELTFEEVTNSYEFSKEHTCRRFKQFMSRVQPDIKKNWGQALH
jgi:hypothetical protein